MKLRAQFTIARLIFAQRIGGYAGFLKDIFGRFLATSLFGGVSSVKRRSLEFRECASQPKAHTQPRRLGWRESALYSFNVSILQKPEPKPKGLWGNALVSLETVLGPAQAALLALALRRRFMR